MADKDEVPFFSAVKVETFTWKVKVPVPKDGGYVHAVFTGEFKYLTDEDVRALLAEGLSDRQMAQRVLTGIVQLQGEDKPNVRREPEVIDQVLAVDRAPASTFGTYMAVLRGLAAEGNS
jgi:hypothetical protein